jgi:hypothetical protein
MTGNPEAVAVKRERSEDRKQATDRITPHRLYLFLIGCGHASEYDEEEEEEA